MIIIANRKHVSIDSFYQIVNDDDNGGGDDDDEGTSGRG